MQLVRFFFARQSTPSASAAVRHAARGRALALWPLAALALVALAGPWVVQNPTTPDVAHMLAAPSRAHWFGTDALGRDLFARVVVATRLDLAIALSAVFAAALAGSVLGAASGFAGGRIDRLVQRVVDVCMAFPLFVVALSLVAVLGNSVQSVVVATALINVPFYTRLARAEIATRRDANYVRAARLQGAGNTRILFSLLLPNALPALCAQMTVNLGWAMTNSAGLSFLGMGVRPPAAEWGVLVGEGAPYMMTGQWWIATFPSLALALAVFALNGAGERLRDAFDPRTR
ncbi:ABC transporter permease [Paraburkholderia unamae]|uniref:Peptide/nickel transport system permease protein n=1 Tax=Paraburkholderia unamae TaxID=219649 RepID=A0ABX5KHD4_9BURK|nr:ABC transporter permease [Paraburkholderia unamae]PVX79869.1 peptide/nickel transport system permease protein [Paraburkholderia unamae]RAR54939.1 peptide/nickel transport system permease protein [Paraburkholderia unamae]